MVSFDAETLQDSGKLISAQTHSRRIGNSNPKDVRKRRRSCPESPAMRII